MRYSLSLILLINCLIIACSKDSIFENSNIVVELEKEMFQSILPDGEKKQFNYPDKDTLIHQGYHEYLKKIIKEDSIWNLKGVVKKGITYWNFYNVMASSALSGARKQIWQLENSELMPFKLNMPNPDFVTSMETSPPDLMGIDLRISSSGIMELELKRRNHVFGSLAYGDLPVIFVRNVDELNNQNPETSIENSKIQLKKIMDRYKGASNINEILIFVEKQQAIEKLFEINDFAMKLGVETFHLAAYGDEENDRLNFFKNTNSMQNSIVIDTVMKQDIYENLSTFERFELLLDSTNMTFIAPRDFIEIEPIQNGQMDYEKAYKHPTEKFEVRYAIRRHEFDWYHQMFEMTALNISGGRLPKYTNFGTEAVKKEFNADAGCVVTVMTGEEFGHDYKFCTLVYIFKKGVGDAYIFYLADEKKIISKLMKPIFHSLKFGEKK